MMKKLFAVVFLVTVVFSTAVYVQADEIDIIPKPLKVYRDEGNFELNGKTVIAAKSTSERHAAKILRIHLDQLGFSPKVVSKCPPQNCIWITTLDSLALREFDGPNPESRYAVHIRPDKIAIEGTEQGQFYGVQTLRQFFPTQPIDRFDIPAMRIFDSPRFSYRGMHLDVARHFMPVSFVKKYIDLMAQYKFNQFHWHLTDDQGWRVEIKKYPKLTEIGSKRSESHEGVYSTVFKGDGRPVEGFYTQAEVRDVVAYAKTRYINVIPEIELPGHASAALTAYPEFGCKAGYKYEVKKTWGIFKEVYCPTDATFKFLEDVLDETIKLFPASPYIHIGGDEVLKDFWKESPFVQDLMKREDLKDEHEVQSYFVRRIERFVNSKGKKIIGWDEILEGGVAPNATIMSWRGMKGGIQAAKEKHEVIMTPTDFCYFDYGQGDPAFEPLNIGGYLPLEKVYSFDPVPKELTADEQKYIIGGQANIWTEYLETPAAVEYMAFPRMLALSEVLWSQPADRNFADFSRRLAAQFPRLDAQNVNYRIPEPRNLGNVVLENDQDTGFRNIFTEIPGAKVLYTTDGTEPTERSPKIPAKFLIDPRPGEVQTLKTIVVLPNGRKSSVYAATFIRGKMRESATPAETQPGVNYVLIVPPHQGSEPQRFAGETRSIFLTQFEKQIDSANPFSVSFDGYLKASQDGVYEFRADSTWDTTIVLGGEMIVNDMGTATRKIRSAVVPLKAGWHKVSFRYNHRGGEAHFRIRFGLKGQGLRQIGGGELVH